MFRLSNSPKTERLITKGWRDADEEMTEPAVLKDKCLELNRSGSGMVSHWTLGTQHIAYISRGEMISMTIRKRIIF